VERWNNLPNDVVSAPSRKTGQVLGIPYCYSGSWIQACLHGDSKWTAC